MIEPHTAGETQAFVLGNGPSLRGVELTRFSNVATIGMNAAYRYWERVGWYPTHYCCLDEELIATHHEAILALLGEELVQSAFVTGRILEFHPELASDSRVHFLESFHSGWYDKRGRELGLPFVEHAAFASSAPSKVTTGAYAVRYAMFLGHARVYLLGVDCNYVEVIDQARAVGGYSLQIVETPQTNPNYFFDDYQREGDRFHIPNPDVHGGNLHLQSLVAVRDDVIRLGLPHDIRNCSEKSRLTSEGVFPFEELDRALQEHRLAAVAVPMTFREEDVLLANLRRWNEPPSIPRVPNGDGYAVPLILVLNGERDEQFESRVRACFDACERLRPSFSSVEFEYCCLSEDEDTYEMDATKRVSAGGHRAGPNAQFFKGAKLLQRYGRYVFMMETDCVPVRPDWLGALERIVDTAEPFWVLGSLYRGVGSIGDHWRTHINGNSVYAFGDEAFQAFLEDVWRPALAELVDVMPAWAYDCVLPAYFAPATLNADSDRWRLFQKVAHLFRYTDFIQNHYGKVEKETASGYSLDAIRAASPRTYLVHGRHLLEPVDVEAAASAARTNGTGHPSHAAAVVGAAARPAIKERVAIIDPDALTWFGHFMAYNDKLTAALEARGHEVTVICNKNLDPEIARQRPHFRLRLSIHSWDIGKRFPTDADIVRCEKELSAALRELLLDGPVVAYMYTGSVEHAAMLDRLAQQEPTLRANVNLFWAAFYDHRWDEWLARYGEMLQSLATSSNIRVTVPTDGLQQAIAEATGYVFSVAPHPSTAVDDGEFTMLANTRSGTPA